MSLLAALAKGFGAGTVNNAQAGFAEVASWRDSAGIERVSGSRA